MNRYCRNARALVALAASLALASLTAPLRGESSLLQEIQSRHAAAVGAVDTFSCDLTLQMGADPVTAVTTRAKAWRSGKMLRCQSTQPGLTQDALLRDGTIQSVSRPDGPRQGTTTGAIRTADGPMVGDPWSYGLLSFYGRERYRCSLADLLAEPHRINDVGRRSDGGKEYLYLDVSHDRARQELWFDPGAGYLVAKVRLHINVPDRTLASGEQVVAQFSEPAPGIFFPVEVVSRSETVDGKQKEMKAVFSNVRINQPLPADRFDFRFPAGIFVSDSIQGKMFKADAAGRPVLPPVDEKGRTLHLTKTPPVPASEPDDAEPTREEPTPRSRWFLYLGLAFITAAGLLWGVGRWRRGRPSPSVNAGAAAAHSGAPS